MEQMNVDLRELEEGLNSHIAAVRRGDILVITDQGKPIARLLPILDPEKKPEALPPGLSIEEKLLVLRDAGLISWSGQKLAPEVPRVPLRGSKTVTEILLEDRGAIPDRSPDLLEIR
jgi:antitoxin (DNA-binding transcriptional repressor) of toxin-antitoxin stability system